jgi:outer membrane protein assembly factor BamB
VIKEAASVNGKSYYTALYVREDLNLYAYSKNGIEYKLNYATGEILSTELIK